jgi:hypothetical protein
MYTMSLHFEVKMTDGTKKSANEEPTGLVINNGGKKSQNLLEANVKGFTELAHWLAVSCYQGEKSTKPLPFAESMLKAIESAKIPDNAVMEVFHNVVKDYVKLDSSEMTHSLTVAELKTRLNFMKLYAKTSPADYESFRQNPDHPLSDKNFESLPEPKLHGWVKAREDSKPAKVGRVKSVVAKPEVELTFG